MHEKGWWLAGNKSERTSSPSDSRKCGLKRERDDNKEKVDGGTWSINMMRVK